METRDPSERRWRVVALGKMARAYWMLFGNIAFAASAAAIAHAGAERAIFEVALVASALSLVVVRRWDILRWGGMLADGRPASIGDWARYAQRVVTITVAAWLLARALLVLRVR